MSRRSEPPAVRWFVVCPDGTPTGWACGVLPQHAKRVWLEACGIDLQRVAPDWLEQRWQLFIRHGYRLQAFRLEPMGRADASPTEPE